MSNKLRLLTIPLEEPSRETDMAHGIKVNGMMVWLPKSQITEFQVTDNKASAWVPEWLIEKNGLDMFVDTSYEPSLFI